MTCGPIHSQRQIGALEMDKAGGKNIDFVLDKTNLAKAEPGGKSNFFCMFKTGFFVKRILYEIKNRPVDRVCCMCHICC